MTTYLRDFINDHCIFRCPPGFYLKGIPEPKLYSYQFYLRKALFWPAAATDITQWLMDQHEDGTQYAAMETAGPPMLSALQLYAYTQFGYTVHGFGVRKDQKKYGLMNWIEGFLDPKEPVVILDDLANSKSTISRCQQIVKASGGNPVAARTIVNKKPGTNDVDGLPVTSMFTLNDFELGWNDYYRNREAPDIEKFVSHFGSVLTTGKN
jgi:orotate phosphoribosyltransferase